MAETAAVGAAVEGAAGGRLRIACLAWGSLVWKSGSLRLRSGWAGSGPRLPIEFVRVGEMGELATTLWTPAPRVPTYWAVLDTSDLGEARQMLAEREQIRPGHEDCIGVACPPGAPPAAAAAVEALTPSPASPGSRQATPFAAEIGAWAAGQGLDAVIWTALPPRFQGEEGRPPTVDEAVAYLDRLTGETRDHAHGYIRRVPADIRTPYRVQFEARLGLTPQS